MESQTRLNPMLHAIDLVSERLGQVVSFLLLPMVAVIIYGVLSRYLFHQTNLWATDMSTFFAGTVAILTGAWVTRLEMHINFDLLQKRLSQRGKTILDIITAPFFFLVTGVLTWQAAKMAWMSFQIGETTNSAWAAPYYPFKIMLFVAALLTLVEGAAVFAKKLGVAFRRSSKS